MNQRDILKEYIHEFSFRENQANPFQLASGKKSPYYFDLKSTLLNPNMLSVAADVIYQMILDSKNKKPEAMAGLTMGADPLIYAISLKSAAKGQNILPLIVRKQTKDHGSKKKVEGLFSDLSSNAEIILIDDVITTGKSTLEAFDAIVELGFSVQTAYCVVDRKEGGSENLKKAGIDLISVFSPEDFRKI